MATADGRRATALFGFLILLVVYPSFCFAEQRPIAARDTVMLEEMTWMEVRDAIRAGKKRALILTGGVEQNGPYTALGKHNFIAEHVSKKIARRLGDAIVAPVIRYVPEGEIDPPTGHMRYAGTLSIGRETFRALIRDAAASLRQAGFTEIIFLGDSGDNQSDLKSVAVELDRTWREKGVRVYFVPEYYNYSDLTKWLAGQGYHEKEDGYHDSLVFSAMLAAVDPTHIRVDERRTANKFSINGIPLDPLEKTQALGQKLIEMRVERTVEAIRALEAK